MFGVFQRDFTDAAGNLVTGNKQVTVRNELTGRLVPLYADRDGAVALGNPATFSTDRVRFYAPGGFYRIEVVAGELAIEPLRDVGIGLAAGSDAVSLAFDVQVDALADLDDHDEQDAGFVVLVSDIGDGRGALYTLATPGDPGTWVGPAYTTGATGTGDRFDLSIYAAGRPRPGEVLARHVFSDTGITFPASLGTSAASAGVASTGSAEFEIAKNGTPIGTVEFDASASGVFTFASDVAFEKGDIITLTAPEPRDSTLANVSITLAGNRT